MNVLSLGYMFLQTLQDRSSRQNTPATPRSHTFIVLCTTHVPTPLALIPPVQEQELALVFHPKKQFTEVTQEVGTN